MYFELKENKPHGTKDDPFVFLCDSSEGYVVAKGSFLNKMAQFNSDGTRDAGKTGYWYQLEFHQNNQVADYHCLLYTS